jgi:hypothetical protein
MSVIKEWLEQKLAIGDVKKLTSVQIVFALATRELKRLLNPARFNEEPITSGLTGVLAAHATWVGAVLGDGPGDSVKLYWSHYSKSLNNADKKGTSDKVLSEAKSGADFALLVRLGEDDAYLSLFQAKKAKEVSTKSGAKDLEVDFYQRPTKPTDLDEDWRSSQLVTLVEYAEILQKSVKKSSAPIQLRHLSWVHYLIYRPMQPPVCLTLSKLGAQYRKEREAEKSNLRCSSNSILLSTYKRMIVGFLDHLDLSRITLPSTRSVAPDPTLSPVGATVQAVDPTQSAGATAQPAISHKGWLRLTFKEAQNVLPELNELTSDTELHVADDTSSGGRRIYPDNQSGDMKCVSETEIAPAAPNPNSLSGLHEILNKLKDELTAHSRPGGRRPS